MKRSQTTIGTEEHARKLTDSALQRFIDHRTICCECLLQGLTAPIAVLCETAQELHRFWKQNDDSYRERFKKGD